MTISLVFVDGLFAERLSENIPVFSGMTAEGDFSLKIPAKTKLTQPIHLFYVGTGRVFAMPRTRYTITLGEESVATIIEEHISVDTIPHFLNSENVILVGAHAELNYFKIQNTNARYHQYARTQIRQKESSKVQFNHFALSGQRSNDEISIVLEEAHAECDTRSFYIANDNEKYIGHEVHIEHQAAHCRSDMLYKGILQKKSQTEFKGKVLVQQSAQKTVAQQQNHHLLLSKNAEARSCPELEIYADDVQCKHGSTVGELDGDALFYLTSRGVPKEMAVQLLLQGFANDVIYKINDPHVLSYVETLLDQKWAELNVC
jgi:Fe-S cluster assembly protein SufD